MIIIRATDTETTGLTPPYDAVCELGWCDLWLDTDGNRLNGAWEVGEPESTLVNPGRPIPPEATAVHHITDAMVKDAPPLDVALINGGFLDGGLAALAAHNARFERSFLDPLLMPSCMREVLPERQVPWICTWKNAVLLAPRAPGHKNQILRYWLKLELDPELASPPHRAGPDAYVTAHVLKRELGKLSVEEMIEIQKRPAILPFLTFGKYAKGREGFRYCPEIDAGYWRWVLDNIDDNEDVIATARHYQKVIADRWTQPGAKTEKIPENAI